MSPTEAVMESRSQVEDLTTWWQGRASPETAFVSPAARVAESAASGIGLFAVETIGSGEVIVMSPPVTVPRELDGFEAFDAGATICDQTGTLPEPMRTEMVQHFALLSYLLVEVGKGEASALSPYFACWPTLAEVKEAFPLFWSDEEIEQLLGTKTYLVALQNKVSAQRTLEHVVMPALATHLVLDESRFDSLLEQCQYVHVCFHARVIPSSLEGERSGIFPLVDLCNGSFQEASNAKFVRGEDGAVSVQSTKQIDSGDEVLVDYLQLETSQLVTGFGHIARNLQLTRGAPGENPCDSTMLFAFPEAFNQLAPAALASFQTKFGPSLSAGEIPRAGWTLGNPETSVTDPRLFAFVGAFDSLDREQYGGLRLLEIQLAQFKASKLQDLRDLADPATPKKRRLMAHVRLVERNLLVRWGVRLARELGKTFDPHAAHGVASGSGSELLGEFCCVCGWSLKLMHCSGCDSGVLYCSREHQLLHRKLHKPFCKRTAQLRSSD